MPLNTDDVQNPPVAKASVREALRPRATGTDTVTIACKLPNGLILHIDDMVDTAEATPNGIITTKRAVAREQKYTLNGFAIDIDLLKKNNGLDKIVTSGYALTSGIPRDFWEAWLHQNKDSLLVKNHIVFAASNETEVRAVVREHKNTRSGLEPINPDNPNTHMPVGRFPISTSDTTR